MNVITALLVGIATGAGTFALLRNSNYGHQSTENILTRVIQEIIVQYQLTLPTAILTTFSSLLWLQHIGFREWLGTITIYLLVVFALPWLKRDLYVAAIILSSINILLILIIIIGYYLQSPAMIYRPMMPLYLFLPLTIVVTYFTLLTYTHTMRYRNIISVIAPSIFTILLWQGWGSSGEVQICIVLYYSVLILWRLFHIYLSVDLHSTAYLLGKLNALLIITTLVAYHFHLPTLIHCSLMLIYLFLPITIVTLTLDRFSCALVMRYYLISPILIPTIFSSLIWMHWINPIEWGSLVLFYTMIILTSPWLQGRFGIIAVLLGGIDLLLSFGVVFFQHYYQVMMYDSFMLLHLFLPATLLAIAYAFIPPLLIPTSPPLSTDPRFRHNARALFSAFFCGCPKPIIFARQDELIVRHKGDPFLGKGPGLIITDPEFAVLTHDGAQVRRVVGPGVIFTEKGEVADYVLDLRLQQRSTQVRARTRDGIEVQTSFSSTFHIQRGKEAFPSLRHPWPYRPSAAIKLYSSLIIAPQGKNPLNAYDPVPWQALPLKEGTSITQQILSRYNLDMIYGLPSSQDHGTPRPLRIKINKEITEHLKKSMQEKGIQIVGSGIGIIQPLDETVSMQRIKTWQAKWTNATIQNEGARSLKRLQDFYRSRSRIIQQILVELHQLASRYKTEGTSISNVTLSLHLINMLEDIAQRSGVQKLLPEELMKTLDILQQRLLMGKTEIHDESEV